MEIIGRDEKSASSQMGKPVPPTVKKVCKTRHSGNRKIVHVLTIPIIDIKGRDETKNVETPTKTSNCNGCSGRNEADY